MAACVVFTYWNSLRGPFIGDDLKAIVENPEIHQWAHVWAILFPGRSSPLTGRPLVGLSLVANYTLGGLDPAGYHVLNIAIHVGCALLIFDIVRLTLELPRLHGRFGFRSIDLAFAVALIWSLHPLNSEPVDYVIQRSESMMALCYLATLHASIRALGSRHPAPLQAAAVLFSALGMACKESMVTAPVIVFAYDRAFVFDSVKETLQSRSRLYAGLAATWVLAGLLIWSGRGGASDITASGIGPWMYLLNQASIIIHYIRLALWPSGLVVFYGWASPLHVINALPYAVLIVALLGLTVAAWRRWPPLGFLGLWFFITLAPTSSIVPLETEVGAERRMYVPMMAIATLAVVATAALITAGCVNRRRATHIAGWVAGAALLCASVTLALTTVMRNREYASAVSLLRTVVERRPTSIAHHLLGVELEAVGDYQNGEQELRQAIVDDSRARYDLGLMLFKEGRRDEGIVQLETFANTWNHHLIPRWVEPTEGEVITSRILIASAYLNEKQWAKALQESGEIVTISPATPEAHFLTGEALLGENRVGEAVGAYREAVQLQSNDARMITHLGIALARFDHVDESIATFRRALEVDSRNEEAERNLGEMLFNRNEIEEAVLHARRATALSPEDPQAHDLLGCALAVEGKSAEARSELEHALQLDPTFTQARDDLTSLTR